MSTDNIVVAIKSRPLIEREKDGPQWVIKDKFIYQADEMTDPYTFDHIYDETYTNEAVYNEIVKPLVHSCISGFNATIFAYGQTSSGKTHTIMGNDKDMGVIVSAIDDIFKCVDVNSNRQYLIRCSFFELYNEKLYDLLHLPIRPIRIREDSQGNITVDADELVVNSSKELMGVMLQGSKNKKMASTKMNKNSSRSHTIFRITIESKEINSNNLSVQVSQLNFVDLAGSERLAQTESTGIRLTEGVNINKSLLVLGNVIRQLCDNESFVSYRDSKLTRILKASLGGNAKCLVIAAITVAAVEETKSTLEFAQRAKKVKNKPTINEITSETQKQIEIKYTNRLKCYRQKILELENELNLFKKKESDVKAVMSFKSNFSPVINRRHTICAVKNTYERCTFSCQPSISTDKQFVSSNLEQGYHIMESTSEPDGRISTAQTYNINIGDLDTGQEQVEKISSQIKKLGRRILEPISEREEYINTSTSDIHIADLDTSQESIKTCHQYEEEENAISSQIENLDPNIKGDLCEMDKSYLETSPLSTTNSTPKATLRRNLAILTEEYEELQQLTSYESIFSKDKDACVLLDKIKRCEEEMIYYKKIAEQFLKCQKLQQLLKNDGSFKPHPELMNLNEIHVKLEESEKRVNDVFDINDASENEKYIEELNAINLIFNQQSEDANELHCICQQLFKLKDILEKPSEVHTREAQTDILKITHAAVQTRHGGYSTNDTESQTETKEQTEEIVYKSVYTQTANDIEKPLMTHCNEQIDLLQITYTAVHGQSQIISTRNIDTQTESVTIDVLTDLLQINCTAVQTEYKISTNSTQTENEDQVENNTQTEFSSVCTQTENDLEMPPLVKCFQVQTDLLPIHHAAVQTENRTQKESKTQTMEIDHASVCIQTHNDLLSVQCIQVQTDLLKIDDDTAVQTEQEIPTNNTQTDNRNEETEYGSVCTQTENDLETPSSVACVHVHHAAIQTENRTQKESEIQTIEIIQNSVCIQTGNDLLSVQCIQVQTDLLQIDHIAVQTEQEISTNSTQTESKNQETEHDSVYTQTENDLETPSSVQCVQVQTDLLQIHHAAIQTEHRTQKESKTQTIEIIHNSVCVQTENSEEHPHLVRFIGVQTDMLLTNHVASASNISTDIVNTRFERSNTPKRDFSQQAICTTNTLGSLCNEKAWQKIKVVEQHVDATKSLADVSPLEKRKQKLHDIYDSNRRISSEFSKEDIEIIQEDLSRYKKEKEEELSKLKEELADLKEENAVLNDEVEYFMAENEERKAYIRQLEKDLSENTKCKKCEEQETDLKGNEKCIGEKPSEQGKQSAEFLQLQLLNKQLHVMKISMAEYTKQIFELQNRERENQKQIQILTDRQKVLVDENKELQVTKDMLKMKYIEVKTLYLKKKDK